MLRQRCQQSCRLNSRLLSKFVIVECDGGWLAWLLSVLDQQAAKKHMWIRPQLKLLPSEYFKRQGHVTFSDDPVALNNLSSPVPTT